MDSRFHLYMNSSSVCFVVVVVGFYVVVRLFCKVVGGSVKIHCLIIM